MRKVAREPSGQSTDRATANGARGGDRDLHCGDVAGESLAQFSSRRCEPHRPRCAFDQGRSDFGFELLNVSAERGLRDSDAFSRAGKMQFFR